MNKKGFTLVELLAVIIILSLLTVIVSTSVTKIVKNSKDELSSAQIKLIEDASKSFMADNLSKLPESDECIYFTLDYLSQKGFIDSNIIDPKTNNAISPGINIKISTESGTYGNKITSYEINSKNVNACKNIGAIEPILLDSLTPVIYDGNDWIVADRNKNWYDYDKQEWANAVILKDGLKKEVGDVVTIDGFNSDALAMFVWIPRYSYTIKSTYGVQLTGGSALTNTTPGAIDIKFVDRTVKEKGTAKYTSTSPTNWLTHPAFTFGDEELSGIWVGKFELSHETLSSSTTGNNLGCTTEECANADGLRILPNVKTLRYNSISRFHFAIRSMERDGNAFNINANIADTHMIKNNEWGAIAYLSQSKYGKYGNSDYTGANKQVYINNLSTRITGISGGAPAASGITSGGYSYDVEINGTGASTTGNIYGVYDMNGGTWEYAFGTLALANGTKWSGYTTSAHSGFVGKVGNSGTDVSGLNWPDNKYYHIYKLATNTVTGSQIKLDTNISNACDGEACYGHALSETKSWYGDAGTYSRTDYPWMRRGCGYENTNAAGVFCVAITNGGAMSETTTRVILVQSNS